MVRRAPSRQKGTEKQEGAKSRGHRVARRVTSGQEGDEGPRDCVQDDAEWLGPSDHPGIAE